MTTPTINIPVGKANIEIKRGTTFDPVLYVTDENDTPVNLVGWSAALTIYAEALTGTPLYTLSTADGRLLTGNGTITFNLSASDSALIDFDRGVYELLVTNPSDVVRCYLEGSVRVVD